MMERIDLSNDAKAVMYALHTHNTRTCPETMPRHTFNMGALELKLKGLAVIHEEEGGNVEYARLTGYGKCYLASNPHLRNPVNLRFPVAIIIALSLVAVVVYLLICILR